MTKRSIVLGILAAVLMGAGGQYAAKYIPGMWGIVRGHLPVTVFGALIVFVLLLNPLLGRLCASWRLRPPEIAVILSLALVACGIAEAGMMRYFPRNLVLPMHQNLTHPGWQAHDILDYTPPTLLANGGEYDARVVEDFIGAMGDEKSLTPISAIPWAAWWKPLLLWSSVIGLTMLAVISLSVLVHRQWAEREKIRYPLAEIASSILRQDEDGRVPILRNVFFWAGFGVPFTIQVLAGLHGWFPNSIYIPMSFDFSALRSAFPELMEVSGARYFAAPQIYPACVGLTFLLASDIGFSLAIANFVTVGVLYTLGVLGISVASRGLAGGPMVWMHFGASLALGCVLVYIGRRYYWFTAKEALTFRKQPETERSGVQAFRCLLACSVAAVALLAVSGLDWFFAALAMAALLLMFLSTARMNAECGTFFFSVNWQLPAVLIGLFGLTTLGPTIIIVLGMMMYLMEGDGMECMMPFAVNGLKISTDTRLKPGRTGVLFAAVVVLIIAVAVPTALWADYHHAAAIRRGGDGTDIFKTAETAVTRLQLSDQLEEVNGYGTWDRIRNMRPDRGFLLSVGVGFALLLFFSFMRLRCSWWPVHPVLLLVFGSRFAGTFCLSFCLGWLAKTGVTRLMGAQAYEKVKPLMLGVIIGDLAGGFSMIAVNWVYYAVTKMQGPSVIMW